MSTEAHHVCPGTCCGFLLSAACDEVVGWCLAADGEHIDLCRECAADCAFCGEEHEGNYALHRDGFGLGPELPLCDACGGYVRPSCDEIWYRIAKVGPYADARNADVPLAQLLRDVPRAELHSA